MLILATALAAESKPLVQALKLKRVREHRAFTLYINDSIALVESGPGRVSAAAATGYALGTLNVNDNSVLLNIGIAGSLSQAVGKAVLADKIHDAASQRKFFPGLVFTPPCSTATVTTLESADHYPEAGLCDMEASAIFSTACRQLSSELIHSLKVVSDNDQQQRDALTPAVASELIASILPEARELIEILQSLAQQLQGNTEHSDFIQRQAEIFYEHAKFSESQRNQLQRLLTRYVALYGLDSSQQDWRILDKLNCQDRPRAAMLLDALAAALESRQAVIRS